MGGKSTVEAGLAERYESFRRQVRPSRVGEQAEFVAFHDHGVPELEVQSRWFAGAFGRRFATTDGLAVEVVQFGCWNHGAGPDFSDVVVRIGDETRRGHIELDLDVRGWEHHKHATNPAYNNVVLHLFVRGGDNRFFTRTSENREVPQVQLTVTDGRVVPDYLPEAKLGRCAQRLADLPAERVASLLAAAAQFRLSQKARQIRCAEEAHGWKQALFQGVAEALGYRHNRLAMRVLAQRLPVAQLRREGASAEALVFGVAGFLDAAPFDASADDTRSYLRGLWETWWKRRSEFGMPERAHALRWQLSGSRPANHPQRRVAALAAAAAQWPAFCRAVDPGSPLDFGDVLAFFTGLGHDYWSWHFTLTSRRAARRHALVGEPRALEIVANWVAPFHAAHDGALWERFAALPARQENEPARRARIRLLGDRPDSARFGKFLYEQQGLIQVYQDFCLTDASDCDDCPFPEQLGQW